MIAPSDIYIYSETGNFLKIWSILPVYSVTLDKKIFQGSPLTIFSLEKNDANVAGPCPPGYATVSETN